MISCSLPYELARRVREATRPVLLVVDYAETRPEEITAFADILASSPLAQPVRVLLLSRTAGAWWANLTEALRPHITYRISLQPLTEAGRDATACLRHSRDRPGPPPGRAPGSLR